MPTAILLAGGSGSRFGADKPKQFLDMHGMPIIEHTIRAFHSHPHIDKIIIITRADYIDHVRHIAAPYPKVTHILPGGRERYHSTLAALSVCTDSDEILLIHDAVRPYVSHAIIDRCLAALTTYDAVGTAIPTTDTIVRVDAQDIITQTLPRHELRNMQTPQGFRQRALRHAFDLGLQDPHFQPTDDCSVVMRYTPTTPIKIIQGEATNIKITYPSDIRQ